MVLPQENRRIRKAEAIDRLLDVANHEAVFPLLGHRAEEAVLYLIRILILVDHDLFVAF